MRNLVLILGDQLWLGNPALAGFDAAQDQILMIESVGEGKAVWSHKARIALFLSAMRHFAAELRGLGMTVNYLSLGDLPATPSLAGRVAEMLAKLASQRLLACEPSDYGLLATLQGMGVQLFEDTHFMVTKREFNTWADKYTSSLRMEFFYRTQRQKHRVLMEADGKNPLGGQWNFDADNRSAYPKAGPGEISAHAGFAPDAVTQAVFADVQTYFPDHPGQLDSFAWAVTRAQALVALDAFIRTRLPHFGQYQDAMWTRTPFGWHSLLAAALNLRLLDPREVIAAAEAAHAAGAVDLASAEGFIRQILGWREFVRGVYWRGMPQLKTANHFGHTRPLPAWYWTGDTHMACMRDAIGQTLEHGYAHHIQRLMVTGQFALLAEVSPQAVSDWYLAVYVDALEWVELPNVMGMALYADGGTFTSKPYIASGQYIKRQSNYCQGCRYKPDVRTGPTACPVSALYWRHLDAHHDVLLRNPRTALMAKSVERLSDEERLAIREYSTGLLDRLDSV